jgi:hypothetical protein
MRSFLAVVLQIRSFDLIFNSLRGRGRELMNM